MLRIIFFPNGNAAVCDDSGQQMPELQKPWIVLFLEHLHRCGVDPIDVDITLPDGRNAKPFPTLDDNWNWEIR